MNLRILPVFSAGFCAVYVAALFLRVKVLVYYPNAKQWSLFADPSQPAPAMNFYGWIAVALTGGLISSVLALAFQDTRLSRASSNWTWVVPVLAMALISLILQSRLN